MTASGGERPSSIERIDYYNNREQALKAVDMEA